MKISSKTITPMVADVYSN